MDVIGIAMRFVSRPLAASACMMLAAASQSTAQNETETFVVATAGGVELRCGQGAGFYTTGRLSPGQVLRTAGEGGQWKQVYCPPGTEAYVSADVVTVSTDAQWVILTAERSLRHVNPRTGKRGSWKPMFDTPLPEGTRLKVVAFEDNELTQHRAYRVLAPEGAMAFIESSTVRDATTDEIALYRASITPAVTPGPQDLVRPGVAPVGVEENIAEPDPALQIGNPIETPIERPATPTAEDKAWELQAASFNQLEAAFKAVQGQKPEDAEYDEMIAEYSRAIEALDDKEENEPMRVAYQQRLDYLKLLKDFQTARRNARQSLAELDESGKSLNDSLQALAENRRYVVVGRLTASVVYNGQRLPLMYRIQSVGDRIPRTLGYIRPNPAFDLTAKVGRVVGIEGKTLLDQSLKLNVVTPTRVDLLLPEADANEAENAEPSEQPSDASDDTSGGDG